MAESTTQLPQLRNPPIVEAVVDIDCDLPAGFGLGEVAGLAAEAFGDTYPITATRHVEQYTFTPTPGGPPSQSVRSDIQALQHFNKEKNQLVQVRADGYTFNRLQPYTSLDALLPEIERTWALYRDLASPIKVTALRLRYINRIDLPFDGGRVEIDDYFTIGPRTPAGEGMSLGPFLVQFMMIDNTTRCVANVRLAAQDLHPEGISLILDIEAVKNEELAPDNWECIAERIACLREFKNRIFHGSITEKTREKYQ